MTSPPAVGVRWARRLLQLFHHRVTGALPERARRRYLVLARTGRLPDLNNPQTFSEKVQWRILNDRRPELGRTCDKMWMKEYARSRAREESLRVPVTLWSGEDLSAVPAEALAGRWVLKPNHRSGKVLFGDGAAAIAELRERTAGWMADEQSVRLGEWAYSRARRVFLIEERIPLPDVPIDYKFFVFDGRVVMVQVDSGRFEEHQRNLYDHNWEPIDGQLRYPRGPVTGPPAELDDMMSVAKILGAGWDFLRIDLYAGDGQVWFGETTPYPGGGAERLRPRDLDRWLGAQWTLPALAGGS